MSQWQIVADFHTHTIFSPHAYSTVSENAAEAANDGLYAIAMTDHGMEIPDSSHHWHFGNLKILPPHIHGVRVLKGIEANVLDRDGRLDATDGTLETLEMVLASMHGGVMKDPSVDACTRAWTAIAKNPHVDIIGHAGTPQFAFDYEAVIPLFAEYGKVVEVNEGTFRVRRDSYENCKRIVKLCKRYGVHLAVNSDAHFYTHIGKFAEATALLDEVGFPPELVVNSSKERLEAFLAKKGLSL